MIAVVHAYSRANAGDGLLVDLTLSRLAAVGVPDDDIVLAAMDAASFADLPHVVVVGTPERAANWDTVRAALSGAAIIGGRGATASLFEAADALVAVGGGYLRSTGLVNSIGTSVNHLPTLAAVARSKAPSLYMPQSIGPLPGPSGAVVRRLLHRVDEVHVRDDRSAVELGHAAHIRRTADLAVLQVADGLDFSTPRSALGDPVLVARSLPRAPTYRPGLQELAYRLGTVRWAVQSEGSAVKSDRTFYDRLAVRPRGSLADVLADQPGPVISVRLHGALQAVLAGIPAIHLGYKRKSWGAYEDLGIASYVHSARHFDPEVVAHQVETLRQDPSEFWAAIRSRIPFLRAASMALTDSLRAICSR